MAARNLIATRLLLVSALVVYAGCGMGCLGGSFTYKLVKRAQARELRLDRIEGYLPAGAENSPTEFAVALRYSHHIWAGRIAEPRDYLLVPLHSKIPQAPFALQCEPQSLDNHAELVSAEQRSALRRLRYMYASRKQARAAVDSKDFIKLRVQRRSLFDARGHNLKGQGSGEKIFQADLPPPIDATINFVVPRKILRDPACIKRDQYLAVLGFPFALALDVVYVPLSNVYWGVYYLFPAQH